MLRKNRITKEPNQFLGRGIAKRETITGVFGFSYANAIQKALDAQGEGEVYDPKARSWGEPYPAASSSGAYKLVRHVDRAGTEQFYLHLLGISYNGKVCEVKFGHPIYIDDSGRVYERAELENYLPKRSDGIVRCHDAALRNILRIRMLRTEYVLMPVEIPVEHRPVAAAAQPITA